MCTNRLPCIDGEIYLPPDLNQIRTDMIAYQSLWKNAYYAWGEGMPRREFPLTWTGNFYIYLINSEPPCDLLMAMVARWHPNRLEWLNRFGKVIHLQNVMSTNVMTSNAVLMAAWEHISND